MTLDIVFISFFHIFCSFVLFTIGAVDHHCSVIFHSLIILNHFLPLITIWVVSNFAYKQCQEQSCVYVKRVSLGYRALYAQSRPTLYNPTDCCQPGSSVNAISPGKNTRVGSHFLLQGIFQTQGLNPCLLHLLH